MTSTRSDVSDLPKPLRLRPGVVLLILQWVVWYAVPIVSPDLQLYGFLGGLFLGVLILVWWLFLSRAPWKERLGAVALMVAALAITSFVVDESIATGMMGLMLYLVSIPLLCLALVLWAVLSRKLAPGPKWATLVAFLVLACGFWAVLRTDGMSGGGDSDLAWRWSKTPEERLLEAVEEVPMAPAAPAAGILEVEAEAVWPSFRGARRDGVVRGVTIGTDWQTSPPEELWRRPVGPGWSSFAVAGDHFYTQEQRGEEEAVSCYSLATGEPVWIHTDEARFWESNAGAGPRGTPTLHWRADGGKVYTLGGTGLVNALDAATGAVLWSRDSAADTGAETPYWGFSGSPLVVSGPEGDAQVIVAASGTLISYDAATGKQRWQGPAGGASYSSPHLVNVRGTEQVLLVNAEGVHAVSPASGEVLWQHEWPGYPIVQPAQTPEGDVLITANESSGIRRLALSEDGDGWTAEERWTSIRLKPYFNDFAIHEGHAYGFDGRILAAVDLETGERAWKGGRYGSGQMVLLAEQDLMLVLSEDGELALVKATPEGFEEVARAPALEGKTWNHPVLAEGVLLVRNDREMAAFRLPAAAG